MYCTCMGRFFSDGLKRWGSWGLREAQHKKQRGSARPGIEPELPNRPTAENMHVKKCIGCWLLPSKKYQRSILLILDKLFGQVASLKSCICPSTKYPASWARTPISKLKHPANSQINALIFDRNRTALQNFIEYILRMSSKTWKKLRHFFKLQRINCKTIIRQWCSFIMFT